MTRFDELRKEVGSMEGGKSDDKWIPEKVDRFSFEDGCAGCCDCTMSQNQPDGDYVDAEDYDRLLAHHRAYEEHAERWTNSSPDKWYALRKAALGATTGPASRNFEQSEKNSVFRDQANPAAILELLNELDRRAAIISRYRSSSERMSHSFCQLIPGGADTRCGICRDVDGMNSLEVS